MHYTHISKLSYGGKLGKLKTGCAEVNTLKKIIKRKQTIYSINIFHDKCCTVALTTYCMVQDHVWSRNSVLSCTLTFITIVTKDYQIHSPPVKSTFLRLTMCMRHSPFKNSIVNQPIKKFTTSLWNLQVRTEGHTTGTYSQLNPVHISKSHFLKIRF